MALAAQPSAPSDVVAVPANGSATVTWAPPASDGGFAIASYTVTAIGLNAPSPQTVNAPLTLAVVAGLTNGQNYGPSAPRRPPSRSRRPPPWSREPRLFCCVQRQPNGQHGIQRAATIGRLRVIDPVEPKNGATPKLNTPPSAAISQ